MRKIISDFAPRNSNTHTVANFLFLLSLNLVSAPAFMLIISAAGFVMNISISKLHFLLSLILSVWVTYHAAKHYFRENRIQVFASAIFLLLIIYSSSFLIAGHFYDYSYDGQTYHQSMVISLKNGWNPFFKETYEDPANEVWVNHYAKGAEIPQAVIYKFFEKIEIGKSTNVLIFLASFFLAWSVLLQSGATSFLKSFLIAGLAASNTVSIFLLFTYYNDGHFGSLLLCLLCVILLVHRTNNFYTLFVFVCLLVLLLNIKFPAIVFCGIPITCFLLSLAYKRQWKLFRQVFAVSGITAVASVLTIGFNPYVRNTLYNHHPFFPVAGEGKIDIMLINRPRFFDNKNNSERFLISLFSKTADLVGYEKPEYKIPFTFTSDELKLNYQSRIAGFGFWFSGIFCLAAALILYLFYYYARSRMQDEIFLLNFFLIGFIPSILIFPEPWWARFVPHVWLFPIGVIVFAELSGNRIAKSFNYIIMFFLLGNVAHSYIRSVLLNVEATKQINAQIEDLKKNPKGIIIDCGFFGSNKIRLSEHNIPYEENKISDDSTAQKILFSESRYKIL